MNLAGAVIGLGTGLFMTTNWAMGTGLVPPAEAGRYLGISNLAGAGAGMVGSGFGGPLADYLNRYRPGLGYFTICACYGLLLLLSTLSLRAIREPKRSGLSTKDKRPPAGGQRAFCCVDWLLIVQRVD